MTLADKHTVFFNFQFNLSHQAHHTPIIHINKNRDNKLYD